MWARINEFHYDNVGIDEGEFIEIRVDVGADVSNLTVTLYNGFNGLVDDTIDVSSGTFSSDGTYDYYVLNFPTNGIQNGSPDGIALSDGSGVIEFISYEGTFTAAESVAAGLTSTDVGFAESGSTPTGQSLQRLEDGTWIAPSASTPGAALCFARGTPIATPGGEQTVETLKAGDPVLTADGRAVPVKWIGRQTLHRRFTAQERFRPVRIRARSLAENVPHADLVVTADHGILVGGIVANAAALVNGTTIVREPAGALTDRMTYYHVETEDHAVILAAGAPSETYCDATTRRGFDNFAEYVALFGEEAGPAPVLPYPRAFGPRQLPPAVRQLLDARALALGHLPRADAA